MKLGGGLVLVAVVNGDETLYSRALPVPTAASAFRNWSRDHSPSTVPMAPALSATALGSRYDLDPAKVIVDWSKPLLDGGLGPGSSSQNLVRSIQLVVQAYGFDLTTPFEKFPDKIQNLLLYGEPQRGASAKANAKRGLDFSGFSATSSRISRPPLPIPTANICSISCRPPNVRCATANACGRKAWP